MGVSPLTLVVFDCDGTLVDSQYNIIKCMEAAFTAAGLDAPSDDQVRGVIGLNLDQAIHQLMEDKENYSQLDRLVATYKQAFHDQRLADDHDEPLFHGTQEILDALFERDILMAVATGKSMRGLKAVIEQHNLEKYFTSLQTPDHNPGKPHPRMLEAAMEAVGADTQNTFMIGDTSFDMMLAKNADCYAVGVNWGYHDAAELHRAGADHLIDQFAELRRILELD